ncbi:Anaerobic nitric oxide reductase transcription regulator NorR [Sporomusa rhizae]|uniref:sigma-54 interaction domain-containing protein n=1 Tax=Sporomusa rhizae TaxID=357999 RepID=UPI003529F1A3
MKAKLNIFEEKSKEDGLVQTQWAISLENILENINEAICVISETGIVIYWNRSAEKLYGIKREQIVQKHIELFFPTPLGLEVLKTGQTVEYVEHSPREGSRIIISAIPIREGDKIIGAVTIDQDVTEFWRLRNELVEAKQRIKYLEYAEGEFKKLQGYQIFNKIIYRSKKMYDLIMMAKRLSEAEASVMIIGESGTGKDLFAQSIHMSSSRKEEPFVVVDCSSIPQSLMESELFGYEPGAFTGAQKKIKPGKFEIANKGTVFLDEIGELPLDMQSKLLRVLESGEFYRVGGIKPIKVNIRVISATNRDMKHMLQQGTFRQDLFYRLNVFTLKIPGLRERIDDIPILIDHYLKKHSLANNKAIDKIAPEVMKVLMDYHWPGNVRELKNVMERLVILADNNTISANLLPLLPENFSKETSGINGTTAHQPKLKLADVVMETEKQAVLNALEATGNNKAKAAKLLNIPRSSLYYKLEKLGIE